MHLIVKFMYSYCIFMYFYCYVCCIVFHCVVLCSVVVCVCVNVYLKLPPGLNPIPVNKIYQITHVICSVLYHLHTRPPTLYKTRSRSPLPTLIIFSILYHIYITLL